jgi:GT2 family glycosyltransferase
MMIRASVLDSIGGLDENYFLYFEETDFCFRAKMAGFSTWYVPESRVLHIAGQSTKVTERDAAPKRLPAYWFESRRRYFVITHGAFYAIGIDAVALFARVLGLLKHIVQRRVHQNIPYFIRDLARYSLLYRKNRKLPEIKCFVPRI